MNQLDEISKTVITGGTGILTIGLINSIPIETFYSLGIQSVLAAVTLYKLYHDIKKVKKDSQQ